MGGNMKQRRKDEWTRLDNASKIFPATCSYRDTKVFRLACELNESVDPKFLQRALETALEGFPLYRSILRRGVFWYYFERSDFTPVVERESRPLCAPLYFKDRKNLLLRVFYYNNSINMEIFHALSDGTGALWFMQALVHYYLIYKYEGELGGRIPELKINASLSEKMGDSFGRFYVGGGNTSRRKPQSKSRREEPAAYRIKGTRMDENRMKLIEGSMSAKAVLELAHKYNTTLTVFLTSLFIYSIYKEMPAMAKKRPVVVQVPINLRQFFKSLTARNFFSTMNISYHFGRESQDFKEVIKSVAKVFQEEVREENVNERLNRLMALERNPFARIVPLPLKDFFLRIANKIKDRGITAALSNIGQIKMPKEFDPFIRQFGVYTSARRPQVCICSYNDRLVLGFTSPFGETDIQRTFFQFLSKEGIDVEIASNT